jgi:D-hydroxyproline dehydrogenase subunit gamma
MKSGYDRCYIRDEPAGRAAVTLEESLDEAQVSLTVNGKAMQVAAGTSVAAAVMMAGEPCRFSVDGEARGPLCGMGICMECRVNVNGVPHQRSCQLICAAGMEVASG